MSEAITLVLADYGFVNEIQKNHKDYDFKKRKIYPLFKELSEKLSLKQLCLYNCYYAILGDDCYFQENCKDKTIVSNYTERYKRFFIEDIKWTHKNYKSMIANIETIKTWKNDIVNNYNYRILSTSHIIEHENLCDINTINKNLIGLLFEYIWDNYINSELTQNDIELECTLNSFKNWIVGQSLLFYKFSELKISMDMKHIILSESLFNDPDTNMIARIRTLYDVYVDNLYQLNLIAIDDKIIFKSFYQLFRPYFVFYESKEHEFDSIIDIQQHLKMI
jgi:hypothetical protein